MSDERLNGVQEIIDRSNDWDRILVVMEDRENLGKDFITLEDLFTAFKWRLESE